MRLTIIVFLQLALQGDERSGGEASGHPRKDGTILEPIRLANETSSGTGRCPLTVARSPTARESERNYHPRGMDCPSRRVRPRDKIDECV